MSNLEEKSSEVQFPPEMASWILKNVTLMSYPSEMFDEIFQELINSKNSVCLTCLQFYARTRIDAKDHSEATHTIRSFKNLDEVIETYRKYGITQEFSEITKVPVPFPMGPAQPIADLMVAPYFKEVNLVDQYLEERQANVEINKQRLREEMAPLFSKQGEAAQKIVDNYEKKIQKTKDKYDARLQAAAARSLQRQEANYQKTQCQIGTLRHQFNSSVEEVKTNNLSNIAESFDNFLDEGGKDLRITLHMQGGLMNATEYKDAMDKQLNFATLKKELDLNLANKGAAQRQGADDDAEMAVLGSEMKEDLSFEEKDENQEGTARSQENSIESEGAQENQQRTSYLAERQRQLRESSKKRKLEEGRSKKMIDNFGGHKVSDKSKIDESE